MRTQTTGGALGAGIVAVAIILSGACASTSSSNGQPAAPAATEPAPAPAAAAGAPNTLTAEEQAAGWRLLFDGVSTKGWRGFKSTTFPEAGWVVRDGVLTHEKDVTAGDIVTEEQYESFDFKFEFRLTPGANSGVKYFVDEALVKQGKSGLGFEYQILDDDKHPDAKQGRGGNRTCGGLYDLMAPSERALRPVGEWNEGRILADGARVEHWLNGKKVVEYERGGEALKALIAQSKWKNNPLFGTPAKGHILLQDHKDEVAFRNLKIRPLPAKAQSTAAR